MSSLAMDPVWGELEDALAPRRREMLANLLAGKRGIEPGMEPVYGDPGPEQPLNLDAPPAAPGAGPIAPPPPGASSSAGAPGERPPESVRRPMTVYETPYGPDLKAAEAQARKESGSYFGSRYGRAHEDVNRLTGLAENWISRSEGIQTFADTKKATERTSENQLIKEVLHNTDQEEGRNRQERIARVLAGRKRYTRGTSIDRGDAGVWTPVTDTETGDVTWEEAPVPAKASPPTVHGLGAGGGVYFDSKGNPHRIEPFRTPEKPPREQGVPPGVSSEFAKRVLDNLDPNDPAALLKAVVALRRAGIMPGGDPGAGPAPAPKGPPTATGPGGRKVQWNGRGWVPL